jgi:hypothetical protein
MMHSLSYKGKQSGKFRKLFSNKMVSSKGPSLAIHLAADVLLEVLICITVNVFFVICHLNVLGM